MICNQQETRRVFPAVTFILALLFLVVAGTQLGNLGKANPYQFVLMDEVPPDANTKPPTVSILSPENNTAYAANNVEFSLNVSVKYSSTASALFFWKIYYEADWQSGFTTLYEFIPETGMSTISEFNTILNLTRIPEGNHTIIVYATEGGRYEESEPGSGVFVTLYYPFRITGFSSVSFSVDTTPPSVAILPLENKTNGIPYIQLNFLVNEPVLQFMYSLDGKDNVTVAGNTTLTGLSDGEHNVTVYAKDIAGNIGASETVTFTVAKPEPLPTALAIAPLASVAIIISVGLLIYFKKRSH